MGKQVPPSDHLQEFRHYRHSGEQQFQVVIYLILLIEIPLVHLLLDHFSPIAAWIVTGVTVLLALWIAGVFAAARQRLSWIGTHELYVSDGLFTEFTVFRSNVASLTLTLADASDIPSAPTKAVLKLWNPITVRSLSAPEQQSEVSLETSDPNAIATLKVWQEKSESPTL